MAGSVARQSILDACEKVGLTVEKTAKTVVAAMDANAVKVQMDIRGVYQVSKPYVDHNTRLKAVEHAEILLDLKPVERRKVEGALTLLSDAEIDMQLDLLTKKDGQ
jgi:hypothetical protein